MTYTIDMSEEMAERITAAVLRQIRKETTSGAVMGACATVLTHLDPINQAILTKEFRDSGFTDDFGTVLE